MQPVSTSSTDTTTYTEQQVCMTLSQFCYLDMLGTTTESLQAISAHLQDSQYATGGEWILTDWQGGSDTLLGNFMYLAYNATTQQYALAIRGTNFANPIDWLEDFDVFSTKTWPYGGSNVQVASGSLEGLDILLGIKGQNGKTILEYLQSFSETPFDLLVTGHSLGGALCAMMSAYLAENLGTKVNLTGYSYASPTVGASGWFNYFTDLVPNYYRTWSQNDLVPRFSDVLDLELVLTEQIPAPVPDTVELGLSGMIAYFVDKDISYIHEGESKEIGPGDNPPETNGESKFDYYAACVGQQHHGNTYLELLGAPQVDLS